MPWWDIWCWTSKNFLTLSLFVLGLRSSEVTYTEQLPILFFIRRQLVLTLACLSIISNCCFSKLSDKSELVSQWSWYSLLPIHLVCCSSKFPKVKDVDLFAIMPHLPLSKGNKKNLPVLVWWNSCTSRLPTTSRAKMPLWETSKFTLLAGFCHH